MTTRLATYRGPYGPNTRIVYKGPCDCCVGTSGGGTLGCYDSINITFTDISLATCGCIPNWDGNIPITQDGTFKWTSINSANINTTFNALFDSEEEWDEGAMCVYIATGNNDTLATVTFYSDEECETPVSTRDYNNYRITVWIRKETKKVFGVNFSVYTDGFDFLGQCVSSSSGRGSSFPVLFITFGDFDRDVPISNELNECLDGVSPGDSGFAEVSAVV